MEFSISSTIAAYVISLMFIALANVCASVFDDILYESNKHNENRATVHVGFNCIFWRCKKDNKKEIFRIAFIREIIGIILVVLATTIFIVTLITKDVLMEYIGAAFIFFNLIYLLYCRIIEESIKRKINRKYK